jgi:dephospho-CoA kinase
MLTIGLTGDVGAGKSTLCRVWSGMGATVLDADTVARDMWKLPDVQQAAAERWGGGFFEGEWKSVLAKIASKIFTNDAEYAFASQLLHGATIKELKRRVDSSSGWVVVEIPLLYECGVPDWFDGVVFAAASVEKRIERNKKRNWDANEVRRRDAKLMPREDKIKRADWVLENSGTLAEWEQKARSLGEMFLQMNRAKR